MNIEDLAADAIDLELATLSQMLIASVAEGGAIGFMAPLPEEEAQRFWTGTVKPDLAAGNRILIGARRDGRLVGTVQLLVAMPRNQSHRCEIAKMMVHPDFRRQGIARGLMTAALSRAREIGKTLVTLDTKTGDAAEPLYASVGFEVAGVIPDYAWDPDGRAKHATTYMFCRI